jgi:hemoglobin-like flavoprotein
MTPEQNEIVRETWSHVTPIADTAAKLFYDRLFEIDPTTRPLFKADDLPEQRRKLMQTLDQLVRGLDHLDDLVPVIEELGRRHVRYGVLDAHYDTVGAALLWTLEQGLGAHWTPEAQTAWTDVYTLTAGVMRNAAGDSPTASA